MCVVRLLDFYYLPKRTGHHQVCSCLLICKPYEIITCTQKY